MKTYLLILLLLSCNTIQTSISKPPNMDDIINEIKSNPEIQDKTKNKIIKSLEDSALYNQECFNKNIFLEKENFSLKKDIQNLELEIQTWRNIKSTFWMILIIGSIIFIGSIAWKFRKLMGVPI
jgi:hypothetical protein